MSEQKKPNPGSQRAVDSGCTCPVLDNGRGAGVLGDGEQFGWWITADCPQHAVSVNAPCQDDKGT